MREELNKIFKKFDGKLVGTKKLKTSVCEAVSLLPQKDIDFITSCCWFVGSMDDAWAYAFTGNDLKDQHLIFLGDDLLAQDFPQIASTLLHEIGHVLLGHRNAVKTPQSKQEIAKQEKEADEFASKYLQKLFNAV
jgi:hypothetical protein